MIVLVNTLQTAKGGVLENLTIWVKDSVSVGSLSSQVSADNFAPLLKLYILCWTQSCPGNGLIDI